jgi:hypothetical protein
MIKPTIHLNGTPADILIEGYTEAYVKAQELLDAFSRIEFNARDYYVQSPEAFEEARKEFTERYMQVKQIGLEMLTIIEHIQDTRGNR